MPAATHGKAYIPMSGKRLRWGWRFLLVFSVFVTNVIVAIVTWHTIGALLR